LGLDGTLNAFCGLSQDIAAFELYLDTAADFLMAHPDSARLLPPGDEARIGAGLSRNQALREIVSAQMLARWRGGVPDAASPETPHTDPTHPRHTRAWTAGQFHRSQPWRAIRSRDVRLAQPRAAIA
jgi:hypothetical protein